MKKAIQQTKIISPVNCWHADAEKGKKQKIFLKVNDKTRIKIQNHFYFNQ